MRTSVLCLLLLLQICNAWLQGTNSNEEFNFDFNKDLAKEFSAIDETKCANSTKLDFALNQFVNAFYEYERLENKYPDLMKIM
jgi:hypothetical protein